MYMYSSFGKHIHPLNHSMQPELTHVHEISAHKWKYTYKTGVQLVMLDYEPYTRNA